MTLFSRDSIHLTKGTKKIKEVDLSIYSLAIRKEKKFKKYITTVGGISAS